MEERCKITILVFIGKAKTAGLGDAAFLSPASLPGPNSLLDGGRLWVFLSHAQPQGPAQLLSLRGTWCPVPELGTMDFRLRPAPTSSRSSLVLEDRPDSLPLSAKQQVLHSDCCQEDQQGRSLQHRASAGEQITGEDLSPHVSQALPGVDAERKKPCYFIYTAHQGCKAPHEY